MLSSAVSPHRERMRSVKQCETAPELVVQSICARIQQPFVANCSGLPGKPDIVLLRVRTVILVHGCFWHRHSNCARASTPKTHQAFWTAKFEATVRRDRRSVRALRDSGWHVMVVWECQTKNRTRLMRRIEGFISRLVEGRGRNAGIRDMASVRKLRTRGAP